MQGPRSDQDLLRDYVAGETSAFAELVARYADLVYGAAVRQVGRAGLADEVTQAVFILLMRKAAKISDNVVLAAWLHKATRYTALNAIRRENRRRKHERRAAEMAADSRRPEPTTAAAALWKQLSPDLDEGIAALAARDREAVILRFLERRSFADVARTMGVSEAAAQMRVTRAIEKLRGFFRRRGVVVTATVLGGAVSASTTHAAAPSALVARLSAQPSLPFDDLPASAFELATDAGRAMALESARQMAAALALLMVSIAVCTLLVQIALSRPQGYWQWSTPAEHDGAATTASSQAQRDAVVPLFRAEVLSRVRAIHGEILPERININGNG